MQVHLKALGCRLNEAELENWARGFSERGFTITPDQAAADLVVVNTCAVTEEAVRKSRKLLRRLKRDNPDVKVIVTGCYTSLENQDLESTSRSDLVIHNSAKDRLPQIAVAQLALSPGSKNAAGGAARRFARGRQRAFIKVQDGCRHRCTYCIVTLARGEERSRPIPELIAEINRLHHEGVNEVVLAGVHLGGYGSDSGSDLRALVAAVLADTTIPRIRLGSLEPWDIADDFWDLFANPRLMPHLHLPIQSGADSVLRRMARRCRADEFRRLIARAREGIAHFNVTTDIIVGFPGETEAEFRQSLDLVDEVQFGQVHVFSYSPRAGTKAAGMEGAVAEDVKSDRSRRLHQAAAAAARRVQQSRIGRSCPVLIETLEQTPAGTLGWGYTPEYLRVAVAMPGASQTAVNTLVESKIDRLDRQGRLLASPVPAARRPAG